MNLVQTGREITMKYPGSLVDRFFQIMMTCAKASSVIVFASCSLSGLVGDSKVPAGTSDPALVASEAGANALYTGTIQTFAGAVSTYVVKSGLLSDELRPFNIATTIGGIADENAVIDSRFLRETGSYDVSGWGYSGIGDDNFRLLQKTRSAAQQARGALKKHAPLASSALIGHLYAVEAFADVLLADLYCSGIPLSVVEFDGDYTLKSGSLTAEVYQSAIILFDSAITLSGDSARIRDFARIGKARALLGLGKYDSIVATLANIPEIYRYAINYSQALPNLFKVVGRDGGRLSVSDGEGLQEDVGTKYASLLDPRVVLDHRSPNSRTPAPYKVYLPTKYDTAGTTPIILASGIEAQLMRAEAKLNTGGPWMESLNDLRTTCVLAIACTTPAPAGSGGVQGLPPLTDPNERNEQVALLFQERALWLFLTGQRQGDMRRMIRNYAWPQAQLYATGGYYGGNVAGTYGGFTNFPVGVGERLSNPLYHGCINRDA